MRIKLNDPKLFFDEILSKEKINLKKLSARLKLNYSNLKQYRRGDKTIDGNYFNKLIKLSPNKQFWLNKKIIFEDNWGSVKGGIISGKMSDKYLRAANARKFRKIIDVKIILNKDFCEFYGALLGDGCLSKFNDLENKTRYVICLTGNLKLDKNYWIYLSELLKKNYGLNSYYYERVKGSCCILVIKNKNLFIELNRIFGVPIGLKYDKINISNKILNLSWDIKKYVLRGLFDTDGCILANKREKYRYPWISISSKSEGFRNQLIKMLREQGYPAYNTGSDVCVRGIENVKRWFSDIGSSNSRNLIKYEYFLKHGFLPARLL